MYPTPRLRFVERNIDQTGFEIVKTIRVLQQWFAYDIKYPIANGEWKDVPLEKE